MHRILVLLANESGVFLAACGNLARVGKDNGNVEYKRSENDLRVGESGATGPGDVNERGHRRRHHARSKPTKAAHRTRFSRTNGRALCIPGSHVAPRDQGTIKRSSSPLSIGPRGYRSAEKPRETSAHRALPRDSSSSLGSTFNFHRLFGRWAANRVERPAHTHTRYR